MNRLLLLLMVWPCLCGLAVADGLSSDGREDALTRELALDLEIQRAMQLSLPDQPLPYLIRGRIVTGSRVLAEAEFGALSWSNTTPIAGGGVEVRVGSASLDNGDFEPEVGGRDGVSGRALPVEANELAVRRELWLALDEAYKGATEQYAAKLAAREGQVSDHELPMLLPAVSVARTPMSPTNLELEPVTALSVELSSIFSGYPGLERGRVQVWSVDTVSILASTEHGPSYRAHRMAVVVAEAVARAEDGAMMRGMRSWVAAELGDLPEVEILKAELHTVSETLIRQQTASVEKDYLGPVIFEGPAAVEFFRQLLVPELSGTPPAEVAPDPWETTIGSIAPTARPGRRLLPEGWTVDDVTASRTDLPGGGAVDVEGQPTRDVALVRDGVVHDLLMSRVPRAGFEQSTGHGWVIKDGRVLASPGVVEVRAGRSRRPARLERRALQLARQAGLPYVLVVRQMTPLSMSMDVSFAFSADLRLPGLSRPFEVVRLYADGRREPVRGMSFVGVDRRALRDVVMAGPVHGPVSVMESGPGGGRFSLGETGGIPTSWSAPSILVAELELRGVGAQEVRVLPPPP